MFEEEIKTSLIEWLMSNHHRFDWGVSAYLYDDLLFCNIKGVDITIKLTHSRIIINFSIYTKKIFYYFSIYKNDSNYLPIRDMFIFIHKMKKVDTIKKEGEIEEILETLKRWE